MIKKVTLTTIWITDKVTMRVTVDKKMLTVLDRRHFRVR